MQSRKPFERSSKGLQRSSCNVFRKRCRWHSGRSASAKRPSKAASQGVSKGPSSASTLASAT